MMYHLKVLILITHQVEVLLKVFSSETPPLFQVNNDIIIKNHHFLSICMEKSKFSSYFDSNDSMVHVEGTILFFC
jgi:hypothetical protein